MVLAMVSEALALGRANPGLASTPSGLVPGRVGAARVRARARLIVRVRPRCRVKLPAYAFSLCFWWSLWIPNFLKEVRAPRRDLYTRV